MAGHPRPPAEVRRTGKRSRCCIAVLLTFGALAVPAAYIAAKVLETAQLFDGRVAIAAVAHEGASAVRRGVDGASYGAPFFAPDRFAADAGTALKYVLRSFLGFRHLMHHSMMSLDLADLLDPLDAESRFCRDTMGYMWVHPNESGLAYPSVYAGGEDIEEWVAACREEFHSLGSSEHMLLQPFAQAGHIPVDILIPPLQDHDRILQAARTGGVAPPEHNGEGERKLGKEEIEQRLRESISKSAWQGIVDEPPSGILEYLSSLNLVEPASVYSSWPDVGAALRAGRIVKFDARPLVADFLNMSASDLVRWEGGVAAASNVAVYHDGCRASPLSRFAASRASFIEMGANALEPWNVADERTSIAQGAEALDAQSRARVAERVASQMPIQGSSPCRTGYLHTRRLPSFHRKLPEIEEPMGIQDDVLRAESMLWLGPTPGGFHFDEEANVYIQLTGESFAFLVPQNFTDWMTGSERHPQGSAGLPSRESLAKDPLLKTMPIYFVHLRPGDAVTVQGRSYHRFMAQTQDRVALNWFFIPKWRRMEYSSADWYAKEAELSLERLALRQLWARTLVRMWNHFGKGVIHMGFKLEYL